MLGIISDNIGTIIVAALLLIWLVFAIIKMVKDRKKGCSGCPYSGSCDKTKCTVKDDKNQHKGEV